MSCVLCVRKYDKSIDLPHECVSRWAGARSRSGAGSMPASQRRSRVGCTRRIKSRGISTAPRDRRRTAPVGDDLTQFSRVARMLLEGALNGAVPNSWEKI